MNEDKETRTVSVDKAQESSDRTAVILGKVKAGDIVQSTDGQQFLILEDSFGQCRSLAAMQEEWEQQIREAFAVPSHLLGRGR